MYPDSAVIYKQIPLAQTGQFSKLVLDYINGSEAVKPFYRFAPVMTAFEEVISERKYDTHTRSILTAELAEQYAELGISRKQAPKVFENLDLLQQEGTFTVTTGHQLALFTGPLFFITKILSTIRLAEELSLRFQAQKIVPVFWMASEDHDFPEVSQIQVNGHTLKWEKDSQNQPVGVLSMEGADKVIAELKQLLGANNKLIRLFETTAQKGQNLSKATRLLVHELFGQYGLIILEPQRPALKSLFKAIIKEDVTKHTGFESLIATNGKLGKQYPLQVTGREINFFYLNESGRNLILKTPKGFEIQYANLQFTEADLLKEIELHPERFSPNVVMRPVYQETILPNLAYIGGPGEIAYWLQLKSVFESYQTPFPMVVLRNHVLLLKQSMLHKLEKQKVQPELLLQREDEVIKFLIHTEHPLDIGSAQQSILHTAQQLIDEVMPFDNRIASEMIQWKLEQERKFEQFRKQMTKRKKEKSEASIDSVLAIRNHLLPAGKPQERAENLATFTGDYYDSFIQYLYQRIFPLSHTVDVLAWD